MPRKYMYEYEIIQTTTMKDMTKTVNNFINASGFQPVGGISMAMTSGGMMYAQALMKKSPAVKARASSSNSPSGQDED